MATARGKRSTLYPEKETHRRLEHFFNRMKVRLQLHERYIASLCSSFTDLNPLYAVLSPAKKGGFTPNKALYWGCRNPMPKLKPKPK